jgi:hypothetical protein
MTNRTGNLYANPVALERATRSWSATGTVALEYEP